MKVINQKTINKIKLCQYTISHYIKDYTEEEQYELTSTIDWVNADCAGSLEKLGWKVIKE